MKKIIYLIGAAIALSAFNVQAVTNDQVCFYQDANYQGTETCYSSNTRVPFVGNNLNDQFSSVKVGKNARTKIFRHGYFSGASQTYNSNISFLNNFNDEISSLTVTERLTRPTANQACFYENARYKGKAVCYSAGKHSFVGNNLNNNFSSAIFGANIRFVKVYSDADFKGSSQTHTTGSEFFHDFNDVISSLTVTRGGFNADGNKVCFYSSQSFGGDEFCYTGVNNVSDLGRASNKFQSLKIPRKSGFFVTAYSEPGFRGKRIVYTRNSEKLDGFLDDISSIRITTTDIAK